MSVNLRSNIFVPETLKAFIWRWQNSFPQAYHCLGLVLRFFYLIEIYKNLTVFRISILPSMALNVLWLSALLLMSFFVAFFIYSIAFVYSDFTQKNFLLQKTVSPPPISPTTVSVALCSRIVIRTEHSLSVLMTMVQAWRYDLFNTSMVQSKKMLLHCLQNMKIRNMEVIVVFEVLHCKLLNLNFEVST